MDTAIAFGDTPRQYQLARAILIYQSDDRKNCAASVHAINRYHGKPVVAPGQPVTVAALERLICGLGRNTGGSFIPPQILSVGLDMVAWWCPASRRRIWFKPDKRFDASKDEETKRLLKLNGQFIHYPPLLFVAARGLKVYALAADERPAPETRLYQAPFWNLSDGGMCEGNLHLPESTPDNIAGFEQAFFDSAFTHNSQGGRLTAHAGGYCTFLEDLARRKIRPNTQYWMANLFPTERTVKNVIKSRE